MKALNSQAHSAGVPLASPSGSGDKIMHSDVELLPGTFSSKLLLTFSPAIKAGFPSPAEAYEMDALDFNHDLIQHPDTTFYGHVRGDSMVDAGINDGDLIVIDRSIEPRKGDIIVAYLNHEFTMKYFDDSHRDEGYIELVPANKNYPTFKVTEADDFMVWGVVQYTIKSWHK